MLRCRWSAPKTRTAERVLPGQAGSGELISEGSIPYTIVHATQFFEFLDKIADSAIVGGTVRLPDAFIQPMASADVAEAVAIAAVNEPVNGVTEVGGPERFRLPELVRTALTARGDSRQVVADPAAGYWGVPIGRARSSLAMARPCSTCGSRTGFSKRPPRRSRYRPDSSETRPLLLCHRQWKPASHYGLRTTSHGLRISKGSVSLRGSESYFDGPQRALSSRNATAKTGVLIMTITSVQAGASLIQISPRVSPKKQSPFSTSCRGARGG